MPFFFSIIIFYVFVGFYWLFSSGIRVACSHCVKSFIWHTQCLLTHHYHHLCIFIVIHYICVYICEIIYFLGISICTTQIKWRYILIFFVILCKQHKASHALVPALMTLLRWVLLKYTVGYYLSHGRLSY